MSDTHVHDLTTRYGYSLGVNTARLTVLVGKRWVCRGFATLAGYVASHIGHRRQVFVRARRAW